jgi:hypothetical protein
MALRRTALIALLLSGSVFAAEPEVVKPSAGCKANATEPRYIMNFTNIDLQYLLQTLADAHCKPVVVVDFPKGKVNYASNGEKVGGEQARKVLVKIFEEHGYSIDEQPAELRVRLKAAR